MPSNFELLDLDKVDLNHVRPSVGSERSKKPRLQSMALPHTRFQDI